MATRRRNLSFCSISDHVGEEPVTKGEDSVRLEGPSTLKPCKFFVATARPESRTAARNASLTPARVFEHWRTGTFELVLSPKLLLELESVLTREKFMALIHPDEVARLMSVLGSDAKMVRDPAPLPDVRSADSDDDYLIALTVFERQGAGMSRSILVAGDKDLLDLAGRIPVYSPGELLAFIGKAGDHPT